MVNKRKKIYKDYNDLLDDELQNPEVALGYLNEALKDEDPNVFLTALKDVIRAQQKGITAVAKKTRVSRQNLHRILSKKGNPRWNNVNNLFDTLGLQMQLCYKK